MVLSSTLRPFRFLFLLWLLSTFLFGLPAKIEQFIAQSGIPSSEISLYIKPLGAKEPLFTLNPDTTRTPASVIKVLTTYASLLKLGFDYRWPTYFYYTGKIKRGVLKGNLYVKGMGDPTLSSGVIDSLVEQIRQKGIRAIEGNIVIDRSFFQVGKENNSGFDKNRYSPYNAMPDAMMFNERISKMVVDPKHHTIQKRSPDESYTIVNDIEWVNRSCRGRYSWPRVLVREEGGTPKVRFYGKLSQKCHKQTIQKVITQPCWGFYGALVWGLKAKGIEVKGTMRLAKVPKRAKKLFTHYSQRLEEIVSKTAKKSNNLYARQLLLFLGAQRYGAPATLKKGRDAIKHILRNNGVASVNKLLIDNGCGLSRRAKVTAHALADVYESAYRHYGQRWLNTLSIAGVDGTIKRRFRGSVVAKRAWMKTGTLKHVKNIGGYLLGRSGVRYVVVILVNSHKPNYLASQLQNRILKWLVRYSPPQNIRNLKVAPIKQGRYYLQLGHFQNHPDAQYLQEVRRLGFPYELRKEEGYRLLLGPYAFKDEAKEALLRARRRLDSGVFLLKEIQ